MDPEFDYRYRAVQARDARFDGWFLTGVRTTGVFCRPSCPARTPRPENVRFFPTALSARNAGFRPCKRCRPDALPGRPGWDIRRDVAARAMDLIARGVVDDGGVAGLAAELGFTERHLHRLLVGALGCGPSTLARAVRAKRATLLLETTDLPIVEVAFAAGFTSLRQFNATLRELSGTSPREVRARGRLTVGGGGPESVQLRFACRAPHDTAGLLRFLAARAIPGLEQMRPDGYARSLRLPHATGLVRIEPGADGVRAHFALRDMRDLAAAVSACRHLLDLDSDPRPILDRLGRDPLIGSAVKASPGLRVPGTVDAGELAVRAVLGQQVTVGAATKLCARLVCAYGEALEQPDGEVRHAFPSLERIAEVDLSELPMPQARRQAVRTLAAALVARPLDAMSAAGTSAERLLLALPGIGPWTARYIAMRALHDPDAFLAGDAGVRRGMSRLGLQGTPQQLERLSERWRPYRAYAVAHLWALDAEVQRQRTAGRALTPERRARARAAAA